MDIKLRVIGVAVASAICFSWTVKSSDGSVDREQEGNATLQIEPLALVATDYYTLTPTEQVGLRSKPFRCTFWRD